MSEGAIQPCVSVLDYGAGNIGSVLNMFRKLGIPAVRAQVAEQVMQARALILPGVGAFDHCMQRLNASGLRPALEAAVAKGNTPILGICVGFQMLFARSEEGREPGLGVMQGEVVRFDAKRLPAGARIPHMGWNEIAFSAGHPLFSGLEMPRFYFVHSYHAAGVAEDAVFSECTYGYRFCCGAGQGALQGVQFHPEKSHRYGLTLFRNFAQSAMEREVAA